jgi:hypothetical protein
MRAQPQGVFRLGEDTEQLLELLSRKGLGVSHNLADVLRREIHDLLQILEP